MSAVVRLRPLLLTALLVLGCSSDATPVGDPDASARSDQNGSEALADGEPVETTTTTIPNRPPELRVVEDARVEVGGTRTEPIIATDIDGDPVIVRVDGGPPGFAPVVNARGLITGFEWTPINAGEWEVMVRATDPDGLDALRSIRLIARHPASDDLVLAIGDDIIAGVGRDRSDLVADDPCQRAEDRAWPTLAVATLVTVGSLPPSSEVWNLGCAGHVVADLGETSVQPTDATGDAVGEPTTAIDLVQTSNPAVVFVGVGVHDLGLHRPEAVLDRFSQDDGDAFEASVRDVASELAGVVESILMTTDSIVVLTIDPNPTATRPNGIDECGGVCFAGAMERSWSTVDRTLTDTLSGLRTGVEERLVVVSLSASFDAHRAPNAAGPDALRDGLGILQGVVDRFTGGEDAFCDSGDGPDQSFVSSRTCVHPNDAGHEVIADVVVDAMASI